MSFEEFLSMKIPVWRTNLPGEVIIDLKNKYIETLKWQQIFEFYKQKSHDPLSTHDYSEDCKRAFEKLEEANKLLTSSIEQIKNNIYSQSTNKTY